MNTGRLFAQPQALYRVVEENEERTLLDIIILPSRSYAEVQGVHRYISEIRELGLKQLLLYVHLPLNEI